MPYTITTKDGITIQNIPDNISPDSQELKDRVAQIRAQQQPQEVEQEPVMVDDGQGGFTNIDVPTDTNLEAQSVAGQQPEPTLGEMVRGTAEAALTTLTGATGGAAGFGVGSLAGAVGELTGLTDDGEKIATEAASALTFEPRTKFGQELVSDIGELLGVLPPVLGGAPVQAGRVATLPPAKTLQQLGKTKRAGQRVIQNVSKTKRALAEEIKAGNRNAGNIAMQLDADGTLIKNPNVKRAIQLMGDDDAAYSSAINFEKMNPATRSQVNKMLDVIESNKKSGDPAKIINNRPANVIGESLARRVNKLNDIKTSASKKIGEIINSDLGQKPVNVNRARNDFVAALNEADIPVSMVDDKLIADTSRTLSNVNEVVGLEKLNNVLGRLQKGNLPAKEAHKLKRNLREMVSFDATAPGTAKVSAEIESAFKKLSSDLGDSVSKISDQYKVSNQRMSESIDALKEVDRQLGKQIMIGDDLATSKLGALSKRIGSNLATREQVLSMVEELDSALNKRGIRPKDDIQRQVAALADLEKIFKVEGEQSPFGFQARIAQGVADVMTGGQTSATGQLLDAAVNRFRSMNELEFSDKMKALRKLSEV